MKKTRRVKRNVFLCLIALLSGVSLRAQHPSATDKPAVHGMLVFGREKVYASHLPMFHAPHNYQVILELELSREDREQFVQDQHQHPEEATYTLAPGRFVLPRMLASPQPFRVRLYRGHFERGGVPITDSITVRIRQIIYQQRFAENSPAFSNTRYLLFGNPKEQFAAHRLAKAPDFDHILQVNAQLAGNRPFTEVVVNQQANTVPSTGGNTMEATTQEGQKLPLTWLRQLYLEFDDLK